MAAGSKLPCYKTQYLIRGFNSLSGFLVSGQACGQATRNAVWIARWNVVLVDNGAGIAEPAKLALQLLTFSQQVNQSVCARIGICPGEEIRLQGLFDALLRQEACM